MNHVESQQLRNIIERYETGLDVAYDTAVAVAQIVNTQNVDDVYTALPESVKRVFWELARSCTDQAKWVSIGSAVMNGDGGSDAKFVGQPPLDPQIASLLKEWCARKQ